MSSTTTERDVGELRLIFTHHGLPEEVLSDNGPQFTANEFAEFMSKNGIKHTLVPPITLNQMGRPNGRSGW